MRPLRYSINVTLDGCCHHEAGLPPDDESMRYWTAEMERADALLFGRVTYEMMASFWPTRTAMEMAPAVAEGMNNLQKFVCSRTLEKASWKNTTLLKGDLEAEVRRLKEAPGPGLAILGSGRVVAQLARAGLVDEFQIVVNPIALGSGRTLFEGIPEKIPLKLIKTRAFGNGNVVLYYEPLS
jgi:dihydrofolate reductase